MSAAKPTCGKCGAQRERVKRSAGWRYVCRACEVSRIAAWNLANPDGARLGRIRRREEDREAWRARKRAWAKRSMERNPEKWAAKAKAHYEANKQARLAYVKSYALANPERTREYKRKYAAQHKPEKAQYTREWSKKNHDRKAASAAAWAKAHPDRRVVIDQRRRAAVASVKNTLTHAEWLMTKECFGHRCAYCLRSDVRLTQDHVIPIARRGEHTADNVVPACQSCNAKKGDRPIFMMARFI